MSKKLDILLNNVKGEYKVIGNLNVEVFELSIHSSECKNGSAFFAIKGFSVNGNDFINEAINNGSVVIFTDIYPTDTNKKVTYVVFDDIVKNAGIIIGNFFDNPSNKIKVIAVTGTSGKTSTCEIIYNTIKHLGFKTGLMSSFSIRVNDVMYAPEQTTTNVLNIHKYLNEMVKVGCEYCIIEVSSHAIVQHRISGVKLYGSIFTNISPEHLDYHKTFDEYILAKQQLFNSLSSEAFVLYNADDENSCKVVAKTSAKKYSFSMNSNDADFVAEYHLSENGLSIRFSKPDNLDVCNNNLFSIGYAYDLLSCFSLCSILGFAKDKTIKYLSLNECIPGRFQVVKVKDFNVVIDDAHKTQALEYALKTIKCIVEKQKKIITVVGCGGNRDKTKRPAMTRVAYDHSDILILTSDNSRNEKPEDIIDDMKAGLTTEEQQNIIVNVDRKKAIEKALQSACNGDWVLIAGRGCEPFQEIGDKKIPLSDINVVNEFSHSL